MSNAGRILLILYALMAFQGIHYYPLMPQKMATHFDGAGNANGSMEKSDFFMMYFGLTAFLSALFVLLPRLIGLFPDSMINLPNKDYWLSPANRSKTMERIQGHTTWLGVGVMGLIMGIGQLTFQANGLPVPRMPGTAWILLVCFFIYTMAWLVKFITAFRVPKDRIGGL